MSQQQQFKEAAEQREQERKRDHAMGQASQAAGMDPAARTNDASFLREYGDADISPRPGATGIEERVSAELSHHHLFGNIDRAERRRLQILNQALAMQVKAEYPRPTGASSKCSGWYRKKITGESKPVLSDDMAREVDSTLGEEGVRSQMQSQAVSGSAWKGLTRIQSVAMTDSRQDNSGSGGVFSRAKQFLFGGD